MLELESFESWMLSNNLKLRETIDIEGSWNYGPTYVECASRFVLFQSPGGQ